MATIRLSTVAAALAALAAASAPAHALSSRAWVSGKGVDQTGCGSVATPCRSIQYAHDNAVSAGGEIDILDPAGYGAVTITKSISVINDGVGVAGLIATAGGTAITINAASTDTIVLRGLTLDGAGVGYYGINLLSAADISVIDCVAENFVSVTQDQNTVGGIGILLQPSSGNLKLLLSNTLLFHNAIHGVSWAPSQFGPLLTGVIDRVIAKNNGLTGIDLAAGGPVTVTNSIATGNTNGVSVSYAGPTILDNDDFSGNMAGVLLGGGASTYLNRTVITGNNYGVFQTGTLYTYGNNAINGNGVDIYPGATFSTSFPLK